MLLKKSVPNNTIKNIVNNLQITSNTGNFLSKKTTNVPPQNKTLTKISVGVIVGGYDSKKFITQI